MQRAFKDGQGIVVTKILAGPCKVIQIKKKDKDGYWAVQVGYGKRRVKNISKPLAGHMGKIISQKTGPRYLREVRLADEPKEIKIGDEIKVSDIFSPGDTVTVTGTSKGKGFAGVVKRWGFAGGPRTHGQSDRLRAPGSIGQGTTPGRVRKGKKMAGRMGNQQVTISNLKVIDVNPDTNELIISGLVPGPRGALLIVKKEWQK